MFRLQLFKTHVDLCGGVTATTADFPRSVATVQKQAGSLDLMMRELTVPRQYFHSKTGIPILPNEIDCDSDDDVDESWITNQSDRVGWLRERACVAACRLSDTVADADLVAALRFSSLTTSRT